MSACVTATCPKKFTSISPRSSSSGSISKGPPIATPALFTSASSPCAPVRCCTSSAAAAIWADSVMSSWIGVRCPPAPPLPPTPDSLRRASPAAGVRTPASTSQPARARCSAVALPMPVEAPVMRAVGTTSGYSELTALGRQRVQQLAEGVGELLHALALERLGDVVVVDAHGGGLLH